MRDIKNLFSLLREVFSILDKKQRWLALGVFISILFSACFETLSISIIAPFVMAILTPEALWSNQYIAEACDILHIESDLYLLVFLGVVLVIVFWIKNLYLIFATHLQIRFRYRIQKKLSVQMLGSYMKRPYSYFLDENSSKIIRGVGTDVGCVKDALETLFNIVTQLIMMLMISVYLLVTDYVLAVGILITSFLGIFILTYAFKGRVSRWGEMFRDANALVSKCIYETINGVKEIIVMKRQEKFIDNYEKAFERTRKSNVGYATIIACPARLIEAAFMTGIIVVVCFRISIGIDANAFIPQFAAFAVGGMKLLPSVAAISGQVTSLVFSKPGVDATYRNLKEVEEYEKIRESIIWPTEKSEQLLSVKNFSTLSINHIYWNYDHSDKIILSDLSLNIKDGESIALIGESGAGKTTLVDIILGLFEPRQGSVEIDGINISSIPDAWGKLVAYVPQSVFLIDDTIKSNIAFGITEENIDEQLVWDALEQAQLKEFVIKQPNGLNTIVGERGVKFSGGQRQRVAIARALYNNPQILVLDEATAALDNDTEEAVLESIEALQGEKTLIIVAHRLTTVRKCDKIYEIKDGKAILRSKEEVFGAEYDEAVH